jgi:hypothetical protein
VNKCHLPAVTTVWNGKGVIFGLEFFGETSELEKELNIPKTVIKII